MDLLPTELKYNILGYNFYTKPDDKLKLSNLYDIKSLLAEYPMFTDNLGQCFYHMNRAAIKHRWMDVYGLVEHYIKHKKGYEYYRPKLAKYALALAHRFGNQTYTDFFLNTYDIYPDMKLLIRSKEDMKYGPKNLDKFSQKESYEILELIAFTVNYGIKSRRDKIMKNVDENTRFNVTVDGAIGNINKEVSKYIFGHKVDTIDTSLDNGQKISIPVDTRHDKYTYALGGIPMDKNMTKFMSENIEGIIYLPIITRILMVGLSKMNITYENAESIMWGGSINRLALRYLIKKIMAVVDANILVTFSKIKNEAMRYILYEFGYIDEEKFRYKPPPSKFHITYDLP